MPKLSVTKEQRERIYRAAQEFQGRIQDLQEEEIWELSMELNLSEREVERVWDELY